jgi:PAS domain-containing protein
VYRWIQSVGEPFYDTEGRIAHWYGLVIDIEDRKRAEIELRRAYDSFSDAQQLSKTGSFITDLLGDDHNWSEEAYRIFEFDPGRRSRCSAFEMSYIPTTCRRSNLSSRAA